MMGILPWRWCFGGLAAAMCCSGSVEALAKPTIVVAPDEDLSNGTNPLYPGPIVRVYEPDASSFGGFRAVSEFEAYGTGFLGGVTVAVGDINGDGTDDIITGAGPGALPRGGPHVRVFDGVTHAPIGGFSPFGDAFTGGVRVSAGDVNGDGVDDIITGAGPGGQPHVKVFDGTTVATLGLTELASFFPYDNAFLGGVFVAAGDVDGDGRADVLTGPGRDAANPQSSVRAFSFAPPPSTGGADIGLGLTPAPFVDWDAFGPSYGEGVTVAILDSGINNDHPAFATGTAPGSGFSQVNVFDDEDLAPPIDQFGFFNDTIVTTGVRVAGGIDFTGDGVDELIVSRGNGTAASINVVDPTTYDPSGSQPNIVGSIVPFGQEVTPGVFFSNIGANAAAAAMGDPFSGEELWEDLSQPIFAPPATDVIISLTDIDTEVLTGQETVTVQRVNPGSLGMLPGLEDLDARLAALNIQGLLPFTAGFFVGGLGEVPADAYNGAFTIELSDAAEGFLELNEIELHRLRLLKLSEDFELQGNYTLSPGLGGSSPFLGPPNGIAGDWGIFTDGFESGNITVWSNPDSYSGYVLAYVPEPGAAAGLLAALPAMVRRHRA